VRQPFCGRGSKLRWTGEPAALASLEKKNEGIVAARGNADERLRKQRLEFMTKTILVPVETGSPATVPANALTAQDFAPRAAKRIVLFLVIYFRFALPCAAC